MSSADSGAFPLNVFLLQRLHLDKWQSGHHPREDLCEVPAQNPGQSEPPVPQAHQRLPRALTGLPAQGR